MMHNKSTFQGGDVWAGKGERSSGHLPPTLRAVAAPLAKSAFPATLGSRVQFLMNRFLEGLMLFVIQVYRWIFSPAQIFLFGGGSGCRFTPTCSTYAAEAIRHHGAVAGGILALKRICRCHPLGDCGFDPVPQGNGRKERFG